MPAAPPDYNRLFEQAYEALDAGDLDGARDLAQRGLSACRKAGVGEAETIPGLYVLAGAAADELDDEGALAQLAKLRAIAPLDPDALLLEARVRTGLRQFDVAAGLLAKVPAGEPAADYQRAILAELQGHQADADRAYALAHAADAEAFPLPVRIDDREVHELLNETIAELPASVVDTFKNLTVDLLPVPDATLHADVDPEILGLYAGTPIGDADAAPLRLPDRIYIFKRNLERIAGDRATLIEQLRITLLHELGHHLGWDEDDLAERGLD